MRGDEHISLSNFISALVLLHFAGFCSALHAVSLQAGRERRRVVVLSLLLLPYVALPLYWLGSYGTDARRPRKWKENEQRIKPVTEVAVERLSGHTTSDALSAGCLANLTPIPLTGGNRISLLKNGDEAFPAFLRAIDEAQEYVLCQFYLIREDDTARKFMDRLIEARRRGVRVYLYYDPIESKPSDEFWGPVREAEIQVAEHRPTRKSGNLLHAEYRNHRKIFVADGKIAIMGGLNLGDEYLSKVPELAPWRDTCFILEGPAVLGAQWSFLRDYSWSKGEHPRLSWDNTSPIDDDVKATLLATGPYDERAACCLCFLEAFSHARSRIWITTPFLSPDEPALVALELAVSRGIEVRLLIPSDTEVSVAELIAWDFFRRLLPLGVEFYQNPEGSMHQKVVLIDDNLILLGSANFDYRSFRLNHENVLWVESPQVAEAVEEMLLADFQKARRMEKEELERRTRWDWLKTSAARVLDMVLGG